MHNKSFFFFPTSRRKLGLVGRFWQLQYLFYINGAKVMLTVGTVGRRESTGRVRRVLYRGVTWRWHIIKLYWAPRGSRKDIAMWLYTQLKLRILLRKKGKNYIGSKRSAVPLFLVMFYSATFSESNNLALLLVLRSSVWKDSNFLFNINIPWFLNCCFNI